MIRDGTPARVCLLYLTIVSLNCFNRTSKTASHRVLLKPKPITPALMTPGFIKTVILSVLITIMCGDYLMMRLFSRIWIKASTQRMLGIFYSFFLINGVNTIAWLFLSFGIGKRCNTDFVRNCVSNRLPPIMSSNPTSFLLYWITHHIHFYISNPKIKLLLNSY